MCVCGLVKRSLQKVNMIRYLKQVIVKKNHQNRTNKGENLSLSTCCKDKCPFAHDSVPNGDWGKFCSFIPHNK